jgi:putative transposase
MYPRNWRFLKWVRRVRARWLSRARSILVDAAHLVSKRLVKVAREYGAVIVFEDLEKLRESGNGGRKLSWERPMWCYKRIQEYTEYKALIEGIRTIYVDPAGTSRMSPNGKKLRFVNYRFVKLGGVLTSRDVVASWNLALRGLRRMRGSRVRWSPDSPAGEEMRNRPNAGNPEAELTIGIYRITSGKPTPQLLR